MESHPPYWKKKRPLFDEDGIYSVGKYKGVHISELDIGYVAWAGENLAGFTEAYQSTRDRLRIHVTQKELEHSENNAIRVVTTQGASTGGSTGAKNIERPGRKYFISRQKRRYNDPPPGSSNEY